MSNEPITINEDEEAEYIQSYLYERQTEISQDLIKLVIEGQFEYMKTIGLVVEN